MARVTKINVGGTNYDIAHEGELKNSGFEVVTSLPTTGLFEGRQVLYKNRVWVYSNGWVSPNNPVSLPRGVTLSSSTEELNAAARYVELTNFQLEQIPELLNKALFISNNDNCVKKSDRLYELIDNETGSITVKSDIVNPVLGQTLRYTAINPSYALSALHMRILANDGGTGRVYCVCIPQNFRSNKAIYKIEYYVYSNATGDGDINNRDNYVWKTVFEKELKQATEILYPCGGTVYNPDPLTYGYIYNIRVSITPTTKNVNYNIRILDIDIKYYGANHKPLIYANRLINYDAVIEPTQTSEVMKSIPWILQYLTQGVNWLKANNVRLSAYNTKVATLEQADSDNNAYTQSVKTDLLAVIEELSNGLATVARSGSYNDLTDKPTFSGSYNDLTDKPTLATVATSGDYNDLTDKPTLATVATSGSYNDLTDKPALAPVATSGDYNDLLNKPAFSGSYNDLTDKPTLATVATSGSYNDLTDKPSFSGSYNDLTDKPTLFSGSYNDLTDKPTLATVATSGSYNDLTDKPTLASVATSGSYNDLTDKPTFSGSYNDLTDKPTLFSGSYNDLTDKPTLATVATSGSYDDLLNKPDLVFSNIGGTISSVQIPDGLIANGKLVNSSMTLNGISCELGGTKTLPCIISFNGTLYKVRIYQNWLQIYHAGMWVNKYYLLSNPPTECSYITDLSDPSWYDESVTEYELDNSATEQLLRADSSDNIANWIEAIGANQITFNSSVIPSKVFNKGALDNIISNLKGKGYSVFVENDLDTILNSGNDWVISIKIKRFNNLYKAIIECYVAR